MLKCLEKRKVSGYVFLLVFLPVIFYGACMPCSSAGKPDVTAKAVTSAKEQEEHKARIVACSFVKKHLGVTIGLESIYHFKITGRQTYTMKGVIKENDNVCYWSVTLLFNGSDWNNINNWAELMFNTNYPGNDG
ncbi:MULTISPECIES: hypothetical protein [unclassified Chitinophaga]|uniref:hypothetical protein n=1 Tax=unclassified Chitinophaga TaxID=2619133 RepID=UPI00300FBC1E